ncbi:MAG: glycerophosphoryl diester phosphodiesterase [Flavobacterium sp.]|jgi:glycerophosphoryl diester phosphodiesterase
MSNKPYLCIAHRGASGHAPENTLKAFALAVEMGCPWVELDVYYVDGELIVIHDDDLDRTTNGTGPVMEATFSSLRALNAGENEKIPTLDEVIALIDHKASINIELKGPNTALPVSNLLRKCVSKGWQASEFLLSSFNHNELAQADETFRRGALFYKASDYFLQTRALNAYSINLSIKLISKEVVEQAHEEGLKVFIYTVDDRREMENLKEIGVDGIFTNYPDNFPFDE